jgi:uncharacterized cupredoxin-like copper-binding protein
MRATADGFELEFTKPVDKKAAANISFFKINGFTYSYHKKYGSPAIDLKDCPVTRAEVTGDGRLVRLYAHGLREGYIHQLDIGNLRSQHGENLLHHVAYYTLNAIPGGAAHAHPHAAQSQVANGGNNGCGENLSTNITTIPATWNNSADVEITIGTKPGLKFDKETFEVEEGAKVKLVFNNNDDMLHNLLITKKAKGETVGKLALELGLRGTELGFIPKTSDLLWNTCLLQPETSQAIYFIAPAAGEYPYICSYPGHYLVMKGVMKVVKKKVRS